MKKALLLLCAVFLLVLALYNFSDSEEVKVNGLNKTISCELVANSEIKAVDLDQIEIDENPGVWVDSGKMPLPETLILTSGKIAVSLEMKKNIPWSLEVAAADRSARVPMCHVSLDDGIYKLKIEFKNSEFDRLSRRYLLAIRVVDRKIFFHYLV